MGSPLAGGEQRRDRCTTTPPAHPEVRRPVAALVVAALLTSGLTELYFSYEDNKEALRRIQREKASTTKASIDEYLNEILAQIRVARARRGGAAGGNEEREPSISASRNACRRRARSARSTRREGTQRVSQFELNVPGSRKSQSREARFRVARAEGSYFGRIRFRRQSQPYMTISVAESRPGQGVVVAEIDLRFVSDVISQTRVGSAGYAFAVSPAGGLIAHPDTNLVLRRTSFAELPQVRAALEEGAPGQVR